VAGLGKLDDDSSFVDGSPDDPRLSSATVRRPSAEDAAGSTDVEPFDGTSAGRVPGERLAEEKRRIAA
jgi:hypothetical protein